METRAIAAEFVAAQSSGSRSSGVGYAAAFSYYDPDETMANFIRALEGVVYANVNPTTQQRFQSAQMQRTIIDTLGVTLLLTLAFRTMQPRAVMSVLRSLELSGVSAY